MPGPAKQNPGTAGPGSGSGLRKRRPSLTETIVQTATDIEHRLELLLFDQLEPWRRDNPSILRGYRPTSYSFRASFRSLFYLHNESVNIWSHLLGAFFSVILATYLYRLIHPRFDTASSADILVFSCFFAGAFLCLGMSATYHAISNHSDKVAKWGNKLDYTGIVFLIVGSYVPALWYGFWCEPGKLTVYLGAICLLGSGCIMVSWFDHFRTPAWRAYRALMFVSLGLSGVLPIIHALITLYTYDELNKRMGLNWVIFQGALYIFGAFLYAVSILLFAGALPVLPRSVRTGKERLKTDEKTWDRLVSQSVTSQESLTSLEVLISFSTSLSCLPRPRIYTE